MTSKKETLSISCAVQSIVEEKGVEEIKGVVDAVSVFNQVTPEDMAEAQHKDAILGSLSIYYRWRKLKSSDLKNQTKHSKKVFTPIWYLLSG